MATQLDLNQLAREIQSMGVRSELYKVLKRELSALGHWKNLPRYQGSVANFEGNKRKEESR